MTIMHIFQTKWVSTTEPWIIVTNPWHRKSVTSRKDIKGRISRKDGRSWWKWLVLPSLSQGDWHWSYQTSTSMKENNKQPPIIPGSRCDIIGSTPRTQHYCYYNIRCQTETMRIGEVLSNIFERVLGHLASTLCQSNQALMEKDAIALFHTGVTPVPSDHALL